MNETNDASEAKATWTEDDSSIYRDLAPVAVPARAEQIACLVALLPFGRDDAFRVVDIGCGEGALSYAILDAFPRAALIALDGSESMRAQAAQRLAPFGTRARVEPFDLAAAEWMKYLKGADCAVSSLCVHHLSGAEKRQLFASAGARLSARGGFLIADLVAAERPEGWALFAATWDREAEALSLAEGGSRALYERFQAAQWNYYCHPDPFDQPSPLFKQLTWLKEAGFAVVDCFWLRAGHAIYGGYMAGAATAPSHPLAFEIALRSAHAGLRAPATADSAPETDATCAREATD
jgi:SAM-dependent methyltransferase